MDQYHFRLYGTVDAVRVVNMTPDVNEPDTKQNSIIRLAARAGESLKQPMHTRAEAIDKLRELGATPLDPPGSDWVCDKHVAAQVRMFLQ